MKRNLKAVAALVVLVAGGCASTQTAPANAGARVSKVDAEKVALARVPNGTVRESELEKENGKLVWSFDIATPGTPDITEVQVDAATGEVVSVEKETPAEQAAEKKTDTRDEK